VRRTFEEALLGRLVPHLLDAARGGALLDLGCGDGLARRLAGPRLTRYLGVDLMPAPAGLPCVVHDLRDGLGPVGRRPFDLYLGTFGVASHLSPMALRRLLREIARHARPGAVVALEALGLYSLEWPKLWATQPGPARTIPYRLGVDVEVHPWAPGELARVFELAGIDPAAVVDRTVQAGPKLGEGRYWSGLPPLRAALGELLRGGPPSPVLETPLPPLPACRAALVHHLAALRRRRLVRTSGLRGAELAHEIWRIEPQTGGGFGHGMLTVGRVR
jgi:SAM-dependent methyltransferase